MPSPPQHNNLYGAIGPDGIRPDSVHPDTLAALFLRSCKWKGQDVFFSDPLDSVSGHDAAAQSLRVAASLAASGVAQADRVALLCKSSVRHTLAWFGCVLRGAVACNLHIRETPVRLAQTLEWLDAGMLLFDADLASLAADVAARMARPPRLQALDDAWLSALDATNPPRAGAWSIGPDDLGAIQLSSGTTGQPKGVMHTQRTLLENAKAGQLIYGAAGPADSTLILMQPSFAAWPNVVLGYVGGKARVVFGQQFSPAGFLESLARERITMAPLVPTMWRMVLAADVAQFDLSHLRVATISGEPPAPSDVERIHRICPTVASVYLSSEGGCGCGVLAMNDTLLARGKAACSGKPVVHADLRIVDPDGSIHDQLPPGSIGEIVLTGPSLATGYWKDDALTRARFVDGWWRSGDLGWIDAEGELTLAGRTDNLINTGGIKVSGEEIERALLRHPDVVQTAVIGVNDPQWGQRIEAFVVARNPTLDSAQLLEHCRERCALAAFKLPKAVHFVATLPTGPTGKLYRRALRGA